MMRQYHSQPARHIIDGTLQIFLAEALYLPTALITTAFLSRRLGPESYGLFILAVTVVVWVEVIVILIFPRAIVKFVGEAEDWRPIGATVIRLHLMISTGAMFLLWLLAPSLSWLFKEPRLAPYLFLFALDIPLFSLARAHRSLLAGTGAFKQLAHTSVGRWLSRMVLIIVLVELGISIPGALLGCIGASLVELLIARFHIRPSCFHRPRFPARRLCGYAIPLFLSAVSLNLYNKLDLFAIKYLGGQTALAGIYSAAQNLTLVSDIFVLSFSPTLLSTLSRTLSAGDIIKAKEISRHAMRVVVGLLPFAGMIAGAAPEIVSLIFGQSFSSAAPLLVMLIFGSVALTMISVTTVILAAANKPGWTFALTGPLIPLGLGGHLFLIPKLGAIGASLVTAVFAGLGALAAVLAVYGLWRILPPAATAFRSLVICGLAYGMTTLWPTAGFLLVLKLLAIGGFIPLAFLLLGEFSCNEIAAIRSRFRRQTALN